MKFFSLILLLTICWSGFSQVSGLSPSAEISVITCGAGDQLYSAFGHSAFRVQDPAQGLDLVYNYGTFDFDTPYFYLKFLSGKLLYSLSRQRFVNFLYNYQLENRWVKEQILDLSTTDKNQVFLFLEYNHRPENRYYKYEFIHENCSTKMPEVPKNVLGESLAFSDDHIKKEISFREMIQSYLNWNSWASLGIDFALGSVNDRVVKNEEHMFLPDYVLSQLNNTTLNGNPLVLRERTILDLNNGPRKLIFTSSPLFWTLFLFIFTLTITTIDIINKTRSRWLDFTLLLLTGLVGIVLTFLWFFSDYTSFAYNFNIAWAFPFNLVAAFYMTSNGQLVSWIPRYITILLLLLVLIPLLWVTGIQDFPAIGSLVLLTLAVRYAYLYRYFAVLDPSATARPKK